MKIRLGTRGSALALKQTELVMSHLQKAYQKKADQLSSDPSNTSISSNEPLELECVIIETKGDRDQTTPLSQIGGQGLFIKEIEQALLDKSIDLAVHSLKDMPAQLPQGLILSGTIKRENPFDYLITKEGASLENLPPKLIIGTGSPRRRVELKRLFSGLGIEVVFENIRGNIDTRLKKLDKNDENNQDDQDGIYENKLDGIVLAQAGIHRLDLKKEYPHLNFIPLDYKEMIPAPCQGILGLEIREEDETLFRLLASIQNHKATLQARLERAYLKGTQGSCHMAIGGYLDLSKDLNLTFYSLLGDEHGQTAHRETLNLGLIHDLDVVQNERQMKFLEDQLIHHGRHMAQKLTSKKTGFVALVGAGPGDAELITVKGMRYLSEADVIAYDYLSGKALLDLAPTYSEKIYVGKKAGDHTMTQENINALLIEKALLGLKVVRLKGGDPYVFGRGSEEALALKEAGVDYDVVPGITSAIGGLTYAGIPITHRGLSASFHVMTGHLSKSGAPMDYEALTKAGGTCVILMGIGQAGAIAEGFLNAGKPAKTPVAIIYHATTPQQATVSVRLDELSIAVDEHESRSGLIVIGEVAGFHHQLVNLEGKPLFGKKLLLTLPTPEVKNEVGSSDKDKMTNRAKLLQNLKDQGAEVVEMPMITHRILRPDFEYFTKDWFSGLGAIVFTSPFGVTCFFKALQAHNQDLRILAGPSIISIGTSTTKALKDHGIQPDYMPEQFTTKELLDLIHHKMDRQQLSQGICFYRSKLGNTEIIKALSEKTQVTDVHLYEVLPTKIKVDLQEQWYDGVVFTSRSAVEAFIATNNENYTQMSRSIPAYSIGPMTTEALKEYHWSLIHEATTHSYQGIYETIMEKISL
ncbi:conserved protein of unknown function [Petrocella atlantisensis]|uniref:Hydroxymethylbilane synthase n=1 Tax=Petrocella atlantisensis TaxID=2173034 RepID=A0A3P7PS89_9FIRM|nr:uroporphyrinogen-III C-methyltransferase [Petrocella atlantisensis]VDN46081.1 conserved protein of unknown function [Petrocella atlantisensis]